MFKQKNNVSKIVFRRWSRKSYAIFKVVGKVVHIGCLCGVCSLTALSSQPALAQSTQPNSVDTTLKELDEVIIFTEKPVPFQQMQTVVAVIQKEDIQRAAVGNVQDLLRYVQGVDIRTRGSEGVQADVSLRGGTFDQMVILLNGINFTDPQTGHYSLNLPIDLNTIERIEILQGPFVWNSGTAGFCGAINIITQKPQKSCGRITMSYGEYDYFQLGGVAGIKLKKGFLSVSGSHAQSSGFAPNTDFTINNAYISGGFSGRKMGSLDFQIGFQQKAYGANSFYSAQYKDQHDENTALIASVNYTKQWRRWQMLYNIYIRDHYDKFELFRNEAPEWYQGANEHITQTIGGNLKTAYTSRWGLTTLGVGYRNEHILSTGLGEKMAEPEQNPFDKNVMFNYEKGRGTLNAFLQHEWKKDQWKASLGLMTSGNSEYGFRGYAAGSLSYFAKPDLEIKYWLQNVYRVPTFTDLYYKSPTQVGNPDLHPEEGISSELSAHWDLQSWTLQAAAFYRYGFWIIDWVKRNPADIAWHSENMSNITSGGLNVYAEYRWANSFLQKIRFGYDYLAVSNSTQGYYSLYVDNCLKHQAKISLDHRIWKSLSASWLWALQDRAGTYVDAQTLQDTPYKPYLLCNVKLRWTQKYYEVFAEASNLFNTAYVDIGNIPQPGRWCKVGVTFKI